MKKILIALFPIVLLFCSSCAKDRNCRCVTTDEEFPTATIVNVDRSIKCKKLLSLGMETLVEGSLVRTVHSVTCTEVDSQAAYLEAETD